MALKHHLQQRAADRREELYSGTLDLSLLSYISELNVRGVISNNHSFFLLYVLTFKNNKQFYSSTKLRSHTEIMVLGPLTFSVHGAYLNELFVLLLS